MPKEQKEPTAVAGIKPAWLGSKEGITDKVLAPWTPIEVAQAEDRLQIGTWGRSYVFGGLAFPTQIKSAGTEILAGAVSLRAKVDGKEAIWRAGDVHMEQKDPGRVSWSENIASQNGKMGLSVKTAVEYDGMMRIDLKIEPQGKVRIEELTFEIPLKSECVDLLYCFPDLVHRQFHNCGAFPKDGLKTEFTPYVWLGNEERGLQWFCESDENWNAAEPSQAIEIKPEGDKTVLRLHLVNVPVEMSASGLSYTFGLMATPVKPVVKDVWDYRIVTPPNYGKDYWLLDPAHMVEGKLQLDYLAGLGVRTVNLFNWNDVSFIYTPPVKHSDDLHKLVKACHDRHMQVIPYFGHLTSAATPGWREFGPKVMVIPEDTITYTFPGEPSQPTSTKVCYRSVWQDFQVDAVARMMDDYDIDGVYLDGMACTWPCKNPLHGCGYKKADGSVHVTYPIFEVRETLRRIYTVIKSRKPDGVFCIHTSCAMPAPIMSWSTSHWTGEDLEAYGVAGDATSLPFLRLKCMTTEWGVPAEFLSYTQWGTSFEGYLKGSAFALLHDVLTRAHNTAYDSYEAIKLESKLWRLSDEFGRKEAEWLPYWRNSDYVSAGPKGAYVSLYKHPTNGVLAVISNLSHAGAAVEVQFNLDRLGLPANASAKDALTEKPVAVQGGRIGVELPSLGWMIVWLK